MNLAPYRLREHRPARSPRSRRQRNAAVSVASGAAVVAGLVLVYAAVLGPSHRRFYVLRKAAPAS